MNKLLVSLLLTLGVSGIAQAAGTAVVGDAAAGQAKTAVCGACHGPDGNSMAPNFPKLAGLTRLSTVGQFGDPRHCSPCTNHAAASP